MKWKYTKYSKRLDVFGTDSEKDMQLVQKLIADKKLPEEIDSIVYRKARNSAVSMIIRGLYLENLLKENPKERWKVGDDTPAPPPQPRLKDILEKIQQVNEANTRQAAYSGILLYCTESKKFLFVTPRNRGQLIQLLGDNPIGNESPIDTVLRVTKEDGDFEVPPTGLVALTPLEIDGTTYHNYLCFSNCEFKPHLSERLISFCWENYTKLDELKLHPSVATLFEKDKTLQKLTQPTDILDGLDFNKLITEILRGT